MQLGIKNMVFEGGGVLGIAYLGVLKFLDEYAILEDIDRVAGTSAGAITACLVSLNLPYDQLKKVADSLDYKKIPQTKTRTQEDALLERQLKQKLSKIYGDMDALYRLVKNYGWYSTQYFYDWLQEQIQNYFDPTKKLPPYTFADFENTSLHKDEKPFKSLYIVGTDLSNQARQIFSYETTPDFEVAKAVRISMSVPLYFESIRLDEKERTQQNNIFVDGGLLMNYPITLFDQNGRLARTLGAMLISQRQAKPISNLVDFIIATIETALSVQKQLYLERSIDRARSIQINTGEVFSLDFDIEVGDETYKFLFSQGYLAAKTYFMT